MDGRLLAERLRAARERQGMNQTEVASAAGVSRALISKIEGNRAKRPVWTDLKKIERAVRATDGELMSAAGYDGALVPPARRDLEGVLREALAIVEELKRRGISLDDEEVPHGRRLSRVATAVLAVLM